METDGKQYGPSEVPANPMYHRDFSQLSDRGFFDLICGIVSYDMNGGETPERGPVAYIWDGTDLPLSVVLQRRGLSIEQSVPGVVLPRFGSVLPISFHASVACGLGLSSLKEIKHEFSHPAEVTADSLLQSASSSWSTETHPDASVTSSRISSAAPAAASIVAATDASSAWSPVGASSSSLDEHISVLATAFRWFRFRNIVVEFDAAGSLSQISTKITSLPLDIECTKCPENLAEIP